MVKTFLIWTCAIIFAATGAITLIGLVRKNFIQDKYLNKLFISLILEIVAISVLAFRQYFEPKEKPWKVTSVIRFLDENGKIITGDLRNPFSATKPLVTPELINVTYKEPYQINYSLSGDIENIGLYYVCKDSSGWENALINDLSKDSKDITISNRDEDDKKLDLIINIRKISRTTTGGNSNNGINAVNDGPPHH